MVDLEGALILKKHVLSPLWLLLYEVYQFFSMNKFDFRHPGPLHKTNLEKRIPLMDMSQDVLLPLFQPSEMK